MSTISKAAQIRWLLQQGVSRKDAAREVGCDLRYVSVVIARNGGQRPCDRVSRSGAPRWKTEGRKAYQRAYKARSDVRERDRARHRERMASDPEYRERMRAHWRREKDRKKAREARRELERQQQQQREAA